MSAIPRPALTAAEIADEAALLSALAPSGPSPAQRAEAARRGTALVEEIRASARPGLMEMFLAQYVIRNRTSG